MMDDAPHLVKVGMQILDRPPSRTVLEFELAFMEKPL